MFAVIKGAGDLASGVALRLYRTGIRVLMTDIAEPTAIRRTVCFSTAIQEGSATVEDITAVRAEGPAEAEALMCEGRIPVFVDPDCKLALSMRPDALIDGILAKKNLGTRIGDAPIVIGLGPGFTAGVDCHAVIETQRGHYLGRVIRQGAAAPNTGVPGSVGGYTIERLLRAPCVGRFTGLKKIGDQVEVGEAIAHVEGQYIHAQIRGILRGILPDGITVFAGMKSGDIDPRCERAHCFSASDKAMSIAGGVLEALGFLFPIYGL